MAPQLFACATVIVSRGSPISVSTNRRVPGPSASFGTMANTVGPHDDWPTPSTPWSRIASTSRPISSLANGPPCTAAEALAREPAEVVHGLAERGTVAALHGRQHFLLRQPPQFLRDFARHRRQTGERVGLRVARQAALLVDDDQHEPPVVRHGDTFGQRAKFLARLFTGVNNQSAVQKAVSADGRSPTSADALR